LGRAHNGTTNMPLLALHYGILHTVGLVGTGSWKVGRDQGRETGLHYDMNFSVDFSISEFIFNKMIRMA